MVFGLFARKANASPESDFWKWFTANESRLFNWESDRDSTFEKLAAAMNKVHPDLTFEFGPAIDGRREFVISAGGIKSAFGAVEALYKSAPSLERWAWIKFRPRRSPLSSIGFAGKTVRVEDVHYLLVKDDAGIGVVLFFDDYNEEERHIYGQIGFLFLDQALGEFTVEMQVGFIEFRSRDSEHFQRAFPLEDLPAHFDEAWGRRFH